MPLHATDSFQESLRVFPAGEQVPSLSPLSLPPSLLNKRMQVRYAKDADDDIARPQVLPNQHSKMCTQEEEEESQSCCLPARL